MGNSIQHEWVKKGMTQLSVQKAGCTYIVSIPINEPTPDLVYKFKLIVGKSNFSDQFKNIVKLYIRVGYNLDIMRQFACLVLDPITAYSYGFLFNCTTVGQALDSLMALR